VVTVQGLGNLASRFGRQLGPDVGRYRFGLCWVHEAVLEHYRVWDATIPAKHDVRSVPRIEAVGYPSPRVGAAIDLASFLPCPWLLWVPLMPPDQAFRKRRFTMQVLWY